jgi:NDP-sugar pyrophosphorylase family protein
MNPRIFQHFPNEQRFDMSDLITKLIEEEIEISVYPIHENWLDVGNTESLASAKGSTMTKKEEKYV